MSHYYKLGSIPHKRHTQFRKPDGTLYSEQLTSIIKTLQAFFTKLPTNFLRVHFYEIALFFNDEVLKSIYERLC